MAAPYPIIRLKKGKTASLERRHPWLFSGALAEGQQLPKDGSLVHVAGPDGQICATAYYNEGSIALRILDFAESTIDQDFVNRRIQSAIDQRYRMRVLEVTDTNAFRLIHGEADGFPGLIVDYYNGLVVLQFHTWGAFQLKDLIVKGIEESDIQVDSVILKSADTLPRKYAEQAPDQLLKGDADMYINENGCQFKVEPLMGQKTGFFLDQRDNRYLLTQYAEGRKVLNTFCYTGGFSVFALMAGAEKVVSIDSSASAMEMTEHNISLNGDFGEHSELLCGDAFDYLTESDETFDLIVLDPPAFAKSRKKSNNALRAYKRLNALAMKKLNPGGILFTFSCSQVIDSRLFEDAVYSAAVEVKRPMNILHRLSQAPCHPHNIFVPESEYLKGLVLEMTS